jgi:branched-chain amino acid transport system substrate-binding protein
VFAACTDDSASDDGDSDPTEDTAAASNEDLLGPENPASGEPVKIGLLSEGATDAFDNTDELRAGEATAEYLNTHAGGIGGRPIEITSCEISADPGGAADCANQMVEAGVVAVAMSQSAVAESVWEPLHAAGVPTFFRAGFGAPMLADDQSTFLLANPASTFFGLPVAVAQASDADKIAFVVIDVPQAVDQFEADGPTILGDLGLEYELVRVPIGTADMTTQMQQVAASGAGVVHVVGNDAFCIAAFQGLNAVGYDGETTAVTQCITDATREAMPGGLEGINVLALLAVGASDDESYQKYAAVMDAYGQDVEDVDNFVAMGGYSIIASLASALSGISGDIDIPGVIETIKGMQESEIAGAAGATFQCGGSVDPTQPSVCTNQWLRTQLDADGQETAYTVEDSSDLTS